MKIRTKTNGNVMYVRYRKHWWNSWRTLTDDKGVPMPVEAGLVDDELVEMAKRHYKRNREYLKIYKQETKHNDDTDRKQTQEHNNQ